MRAADSKQSSMRFSMPWPASRRPIIPSCSPRRWTISSKELERRIAIFARQVLSRLDPYKAILQALQTIPGIDKMGAGMLLVEIGNDMAAFGTAEKPASWAGVCPGNHESAGKRVAGKKRKGQSVRPANPM